MVFHRKKLISVGVVFSALGLVALCFQNYTTLDFTKPIKEAPPTALEKAIERADHEQLKRKKKLGVDDRQIQKSYLTRRRTPNSIGDLSMEEVEKVKKERRDKARELRQKSSSRRKLQTVDPKHLSVPESTLNSKPQSAR